MDNKADIKQSLDLEQSHEEAPPPYSENAQGTNSKSPRPSNAESSSSAQNNHVVDIPTHFSLYRSAHGLGNHFVIGVHRTEPLFAVTTHFGWKGRPDVVLHSGPTKDSPMLAGVDSDLFRRSTPATLCLPGQPKIEQDVQISREGGAHRFIVEDEHEGRIVYEWLPSLTPPVASMGGRSHWELVRYPEFHADQGKLIIANWNFELGMSMSKELTFEFLDPRIQLTTRDTWAVMALITALRIWDKRGKAVNNAGGN